MLDDLDLEEMRNAISELLPSTCNRLTYTYSSNGAGGGTITWGTATPDIPCRLDNRGGQEQLANGGTRPFNALILSIPYDTTLNNQDRIEFENETFLVTSVTPLDASWSLVKRVTLERAS